MLLLDSLSCPKKVIDFRKYDNNGSILVFSFYAPLTLLFNFMTGVRLMRYLSFILTEALIW